MAQALAPACARVRPICFAGDEEVRAGGPMLLDEEIVRCWRKVARRGAPPDPLSSSSYGLVGYGVNVDGPDARRLIRLLSERAARRPPALRPPGWQAHMPWLTDA